MNWLFYLNTHHISSCLAISNMYQITLSSQSACRIESIILLANLISFEIVESDLPHDFLVDQD
jgi:hypothetical protein